MPILYHHNLSKTYHKTLKKTVPMTKGTGFDGYRYGLPQNTPKLPAPIPKYINNMEHYWGSMSKRLGSSVLRSSLVQFLLPFLARPELTRSCNFPDLAKNQTRLTKTGLTWFGLSYFTNLNQSWLRLVQYLQNASKNIENKQYLTDLLKIY